jgi:Zn-dependent protease with chaperone function
VEVLLNWLVQGVVIATATAAGLRIIPRSRTQARYGFIAGAYLLVLTLPAVPSILAGAGSRPPDFAAPLPVPVVTLPVTWWTSSAVPLVLGGVWFGSHAVWLLIAARAVRVAKRHAVACPPERLARLRYWSSVSTSGRPAPVVLSNHVRFAAVLGCGSPSIALAPGIVDALSAADLDRVIIHEWAHVQRRDDIAQAIQHLGRLLVGWHPAVWWLERQLEFEREVACDDLVVDVTGSAKAYAACLVTVAALSPPVPPITALAVVPSSCLRARLVRILRERTGSRTRPWRAVAMSGVVALAACALMLGDVRVAVASIASSLPVAVASRPVGVGAFASALRDGREVERVSLGSAAPAASNASRRRVASALRENEGPRVGDEASAVDAAVTSGSVPVPLQSSDQLRADSFSLAAPALEAHSTQASDTTPPASDATNSQPLAAGAGRSPWQWAADTGVSIGRGSQAASVATAGFFSRFGKKLAASF